MPCFMPENLHPQDGADAAAQDCSEEQRFFGNAPFFVTSLLLINSHKHKPKNIDKSQIKEHNVSNYSKIHGYSSKSDYNANSITRNKERSKKSTCFFI